MISECALERTWVIYSLVHDDTDSVVQQTLSKDDGVQLRVDLVLVKDGEDGHRVGGRQRRPERQALNQGELQRFEAEERVDVYQNTALYVISRMSKGL